MSGGEHVRDFAEQAQVCDLKIITWLGNNSFKHHVHSDRLRWLAVFNKYNDQSGEGEYEF